MPSTGLRRCRDRRRGAPAASNVGNGFLAISPININPKYCRTDKTHTRAGMLLLNLLFLDTSLAVRSHHEAFLYT